MVTTVLVSDPTGGSAAQRAANAELRKPGPDAAKRKELAEAREKAAQDAAAKTDAAPIAPAATASAHSGVRSPDRTPAPR